jgi:hypothetical protein
MAAFLTHNPRAILNAKRRWAADDGNATGSSSLVILGKELLAHRIKARFLVIVERSVKIGKCRVIVRPEEMNVPGFDFHPLRGFKPTRYSVHVNGPWCITFEFEDGDACRVDFEQYH